MPLSKGSKKTLQTFDQRISYRADEEKDRFRDARDVFFNKSRLETRHGFSRFNDTSLGGEVLSMSFFKKTDGTKILLSKVGSTIYKVNPSGSPTSLNSGLTTTTKHRGITLNNRHIVSIENDGLFSYDGTTFTQLGQAPPSSPSVAAASSGTIAADDYTAEITFYSTSLGFESNAQSSSSVTVNGSEKIAVTDIPGTADNAFIDKVRVYLRADGGNAFFIEEINLGTTSYDITADATSTQQPPTTNAAPLGGGAKFLTTFNRQLVYAGNNTFKNDVFFSETDLPDAFNDTETALRLQAPGDGEITGLATGFFNDSQLDPYLVIFKRNSTHIYSEVGGNARFVTINEKIGCVNSDTVIVRNGDVFFLSTSGWRGITNGRLFRNNNGDVVTLGEGDIDDIFSSPGFVYELNKQQSENFFGVYYSTLDQYITWVAEGSNTSLEKQYVYQFDIGGFTTYQFNRVATAAIAGIDLEDDEVVYFGDNAGWIYQHSIKEDRNDVDGNGSNVNIDAFAITNWFGGSGDFDSTYNFRELVVRAINSENDITVRAFVNYDQGDGNIYNYSFPNPQSGFILDVSKLDEGVFSDERILVTARSDINRVGENIAIGFYQNASDGNMNLVNAQLHFSKNGNRNLT